jgi:hypothetical protein
MSLGCEPDFYSRQIVSGASPEVTNSKVFDVKNAADYSTKGSDNFCLTGAFLSVTYCGRPSRYGG